MATRWASPPERSSTERWPFPEDRAIRASRRPLDHAWLKTEHQVPSDGAMW